MINEWNTFQTEAPLDRGEKNRRVGFRQRRLSVRISQQQKNKHGIEHCQYDEFF